MGVHVYKVCVDACVYVSVVNVELYMHVGLCREYLHVWIYFVSQCVYM